MMSIGASLISYMWLCDFGPDSVHPCWRGADMLEGSQHVTPDEMDALQSALREGE